MAIRWLILTGEYPPTAGGVSDYTRGLVAGLMAAGDRVMVVSAPVGGGDRSEQEAGADIEVRWLADHFGLQGLRQLLAIERRLDPSARLLIQYVPHSYGWRAMNLPFCRWVRQVAKRRSVWVMFHEVAYPLEPGQPWRHRLLARITRRMAHLLVEAAEQVFVAIPAWGNLLQEIDPTVGPVTWLPVPSNVALVVKNASVAEVRSRYLGCDGHVLIGHFGTFGGLIARLLDEILPATLRADYRRKVLLIGRGSVGYRDMLARRHPELERNLHAVEGLASQDVANHLAACELLIQPYSDGISSRRTSAMAGLALGLPIVTHRGHLTEPIWASSGAVTLADDLSAGAFAAKIASILADPLALEDLGRRGQGLYRERFSIERMVETLRGLAAEKPM